MKALRPRTVRERPLRARERNDSELPHIEERPSENGGLFFGRGSATVYSRWGLGVRRASSSIQERAAAPQISRAKLTVHIAVNGDTSIRSPMSSPRIIPT